MNAALETSRIWARTHTARISTLPRYAHALCSLLTELTKSTLPIIDSLTVPMGAPAASSPNAASAFSSWVSTQVSTWGGLLRAHYSCADCLTHPLPRKSSPARQRLTLRKAVSVKPSHLLQPHRMPYGTGRTPQPSSVGTPPGEGLRDTLPTNPIVHVQNTARVPLAAVLHKCAGSCNTIPSLVSRETKAHPFHTGLDRIPASYVSVDTEVGPRHIRPRPHRRIHLR